MAGTARGYRSDARRERARFGRSAGVRFGTEPLRGSPSCDADAVMIKALNAAYRKVDAMHHKSLPIEIKTFEC